MKFNIYYFLILISILLTGCTDLEEEPLDQLSSDQFFSNETQVAAAVRGVYASLLQPHDFRVMWYLQEVTTEIGITPSRAGGWASDGEQKYKQHTWDETDRFLREMYTWYGRTVGRANTVINILQEGGEFDAFRSEAIFYRAWAYFNLLDLYGNVPIVTETFEDPADIKGNRPIGEQRAKVFRFVENDLLKAIEGLPPKSSVGPGYYPRPTRETALSVLAKLYLNAEIWSGTPRWQDCIDVCDQVIATNEFSLTPVITDSYVPENQDSPEIIFSIVKSNLGESRADGNFINQLSLPPSLTLQVLQLPWGGWGGNSMTQQHYEAYEDDDFRKSLILFGPQLDPEGNEVINIKDIDDLFDAKVNEGLKSLKYVPDPEQNGPYARNDVVLLRYADILLSKAEAQIRLGGPGAGDELINQVRERNFEEYTPLSGIDLDFLLAERGREFSYDNLRRQDLIRFGKFISNTHKFKVNFDDFRIVFPIPQQEVDINPNLDQNPGY